MRSTQTQRATFGERLRELRGPRTLEDIAEQIRSDSGLKIRAQQLSAYERGEYAPSSVDAITAVADAYGADPRELLDALGLSDTTPVRVELDELRQQVLALRERMDSLEQLLARLEAPKRQAPTRSRRDGGGRR